MTILNTRGRTMPALQFDFNFMKLAKSKLRGRKNPSGYWRPGGAVELKQVPTPVMVADDWVILKTTYCGICGSDMKELTLTGAFDNPLQTFLSFPQIMGHEVVGVIEQAGTKVSSLKPGDRVAINPWFSCAPRGIDPPCPRCQAGDFTHCHNFRRGNLPPGMHLGVTKGFGGFAPYVAVHESQCFIIPDGVSFEAAALADPFAVAFHSCLTLRPESGSTILVYGLGIVGLATLIWLKNIFKVEHVVAVGRYPFQKDIALQAGARHVFMSHGEKLVQEVAAYVGAELYTPDRGWQWAVDGVHGIIDTVGSASSLEAGMRFLTTQGRLVFTGVDPPRRCENTPHYFKELEIIGSNACAIEQFQGQRAHAMEFYLKYAHEKLIDAAHLITHKFKLEQYRDAFDALAHKQESKAIKVIFDFNE